MQYECTNHNSAELNISSCSIILSENECKHNVKFQVPIKQNPIWKNLPLTCKLNQDNMCTEITEIFQGDSPILCSIGYLKRDVSLVLVIRCIQSIISLLSELDDNGWTILNARNKMITPKIICSVILNVRSDWSVVQTHKYLQVKRNKNNLSLLPKTLLHFLCRRESKAISEPCSYGECKLKREHPYFLSFPDELLHRCFCGSTDSVKCNDFQRNNIMEIFKTI